MGLADEPSSLGNRDIGAFLPVHPAERGTNEGYSPPEAAVAAGYGDRSLIREGSARTRTDENGRSARAPSAHELREARRRLATLLLPQAVGRVLIVDDSEIFLRAATALVLAEEELDVVGVARSGEEAIRLLPDLKPDLVLLDAHMPGLSGIETARIIRARNPEAVVILVSSDPAGLQESACAAGAAALLDKAHLRLGTLDALWLAHMPDGR